ncbi:odorant receptor 85c-like [Onthophagus taurus]|uniref:odorant receptor 85c-like n=1 Tax=Onthophagus taurus TaxID=166361 RepID=UPI0039BDAB3F
MEVEYVKKYALFHLNLLGLNPFNRNIWADIRTFFYVIILIFPSILLCINVYKNTDGLDGLQSMIYLFPPADQVLFKLVCTIYFNENIKKVIDRINLFWNNDVYGDEFKKHLENKNQEFLKILNKYRIMLFVTVIGYDINIAVAEYKVFEKQLEWSEYASMIIDQTYLTTLGYSMIVYDSMFFTLINCAVIQMIKVQYGLEHLDMTRDPKETYTEFCKLVKYHDFILRFITYINGIYSIQLLNHFFTTTCCICVGIFMLNVDGFEIYLIINYLYFLKPFLVSHHQRINYRTFRTWFATIINYIFIVLTDKFFLMKWKPLGNHCIIRIGTKSFSQN